jgi:hypothetical protein
MVAWGFMGVGGRWWVGVRKGVGVGVRTPMDVRAASRTGVSRLRRYVPSKKVRAVLDSRGMGVGVGESHMAVVGEDRVVVGVQRVGVW